VFRFASFTLDPRDRMLDRAGVRVELNPRYLDALILLVSEGGKLVTKDRFHDDVWRGVPVTDEALTQCIKTLRRQLGDDAANPRFIETVPKHGYRFIAPIDMDPEAKDAPPPEMPRPTAVARPWQDYLLLGAAGTVGAGLAGGIGGLIYGFAGASQPLEPGMGAVSVLLVLVCVTILVALMGGAGVAFGIALMGLKTGRLWQWSPMGGALGGLIVGAVVKLLGLDAFNLLLGQSPGDIAGAAEGAILGGAVGLGGWLGSRGARAGSLRYRMAIAAAAGGGAGLLIALTGGRLMAGSLDLLARQFPASRLHLDQIGALFGESGFGPISQAVTGGLEGALFSGLIVGAMLIAQRNLGKSG